MHAFRPAHRATIIVTLGIFGLAFALSFLRTPSENILGTLPLSATGTTLRAVPASQEVEVGESFPVDIVLDTGAKAIAGYEVAFTLSPNVSLVSYSTGAAIFDLFIREPVIGAAQQRISAVTFSRGYVGSNGLLVSLALTCNAAGPVTLSFDPSSEILRYEDISNDLQRIQDGSYVCKTVDGEPPQISEVQASVDGTTSLITWITNELADTQVEYGTTQNYGTETPLDSALTTDHAVQLSGLTQGVTYHYRVRSTDEAGNVSYSPDHTFTVSGVVDGLSPTMTSLNTFVSGTSVKVTWDTDEPADSTLRYGLTMNYTASLSNPALELQHAIILTGLDAGKTYYYEAQSRDAAGNAQAVRGTFKTQRTPAEKKKR